MQRRAEANQAFPAAPVARLLLVAVAYYVAARLSLRIALVGGVVTPIWPPTGIAFVGLLVYGVRVWPAIAAAALVVNIPLTDSVGSAVLIAVGNTLGPLVAVGLLRTTGFRRELDRLRDALAMVVLGALVAMTVSASFGTVALYVGGIIERDDFGNTWATWWAGDATGILVFAPFLLSLLHPHWRGWVPALEASILVGALGVVAFIVFRTELESTYLVFPFLIWAGVRFGYFGASAATLTVVSMAVWAAVDEVGPFADTTLLRRMLTLQVYNAVAALTSFVLVAIMTERRAALNEAFQGFERERRIAETLQRSLLPEQLPEIPGLALASRYLPGAAGMNVGGDWYDAFLLPGGLVGLTIGDVVGRGLGAAAAMGQLRTALRAYALETKSPAEAVERLTRLVQDFEAGQMATLIYAVLEPATGRLTLSAAGHPPPLLVGPDGQARFLSEGRSPPLGVAPGSARDEVVEIEPGSTLLFFTDGLVESRVRSIDESLESLRDAVTGYVDDAEALCDLVLEPPRPEAPGDDVALLAVRLLPVDVGHLALTLPAEPHVVALVRRSLSGWLAGLGATMDENHDLVLACDEAVSNVLEHAYGPSGGSVQIEATGTPSVVHITISDAGRWRAPRDEGRGRGLHIMRSLVDSVDTVRGDSGTTIELRRRLGRAAPVALTAVATPPLALAGETRDVAIVRLEGDIDLDNASSVYGQLLSVIGNDALGLVVDLTTVSHVDSAGIRVLYRVAARLAQHRQEMRVVVPAASPVRRVLTFADLDRRAPLAETADEAVAAIRTRLAE